VCRSARVVQQPHHARWVGPFNELTHHFVVKVRHVLPREAFVVVLLLLALDSEVDEDLLKCLVHKVDAELLETVVVEDFEAVDLYIDK
jgi:hypothetical protein